jgi:hypothetical protein
MKILLTSLFGIFLSVSAFADCASHGLSVFPHGQTITPNSIFVLDGYAESQKIILGLNYLKSGNLQVRLIVSEICVGQFYLTQAVLKPETELEPGLEYTLYIDNMPQYETLDKYNSTSKKYESASYKVSSEKDIKEPVVESKPMEVSKKLVHYGCGPSMYVVFDNPAKDNSELLIRATVKNLKTNKETTYYIIPDGDEINVGHGMCSGAFQFPESNDYEVEFSFMDASGNVTSWTGERIKFTKPNEQSDHTED